MKYWSQMVDDKWKEMHSEAKKKDGNDVYVEIYLLKRVLMKK